MSLDGKTIAGVPLLKVRTVLMRAPDWFNEDYFRDQFKLTKAQAQTLLKALAAEDYIERTPDPEWPWMVGNQGQRLCNKLGLRRISRAKAESLVAGLIERARQVNEDPCWLYRVKMIRAFGSYATDASDLGDVDLLLEMEPKDPDQKKHHAMEKQRVREAREGGRRFRSFIQELGWPRTEVERLLRGRSPYLRFHNLSDSVAKAEAKLVLFDGGSR